MTPHSISTKLPWILLLIFGACSTENDPNTGSNGDTGSETQSTFPSGESATDASSADRGGASDDEQSTSGEELETSTSGPAGDSAQDSTDNDETESGDHTGEPGEESESESETGEVKEDPSGSIGCLPLFEEVCKPSVNYSNEGGDIFDRVFPEGGAAALQQATCTVCSILFRDPSEVPQIDSIDLKIYDFDGVANAGGNTINFSTRHLDRYQGSSDEVARREFMGVLVHEGTHLYQNDQGQGCMVEGMADFVRIRAGLYEDGRRQKGGEWDDCYTTGGFFFSWLAGPCDLHDDSHPTADSDIGYEINKRMGGGWSTDIFIERFGSEVGTLWDQYQADI